MDTPKPAMRGRYCIRNPIINAAFYGMDALLSVAARLRAGKAQTAPPRSILISDLAHLGDLVVATALLPALKSAFPGCRVGFLVGTWARPVLDGHPLVDRIHVLDHWAYNRASLSKPEKFRQYLRTRRIALAEIRAARYDAALELGWNFPNALPLLWQARIPARIGYRSGGFGPLATHGLDFDGRPRHVLERHLALLRALPVREQDLACAAPSLPPVGRQDEAVAEREMQAAGQKADRPIVFHVGSGEQSKEWAAGKWRALAEAFVSGGDSVAFTGHGDRDKALISGIIAGLPGCFDLCNRLPWPAFVAAIARARMVICVDTVAGHVAGAVGTPCLVLTTGRWPYLWRPTGPASRTLLHPVPCAPCYRSRGCAGMECLRDIAVETAYEAAQALLPGLERATL